MQNFEQMFKNLTGHGSFPWQRRLYESFCNGDIPAVCDIPTGLGKTSVIAIWLLALASREPGIQLPRRLVYAVNRRTIVDQSTDVVVELCKRLKEAAQDKSSPLNETAKALKAMCSVGNSDGALLSVSTLRGELADNLQWRFDPMQPAVMIGTVDMIGSKLLFSGYGDTRRTRPLNAGLIGCDTLLVHDEAHLTPAFSLLLRIVEGFQKKVHAVPGIPLLRVLELSATSRQENGIPFQIDNTDYEDKTIGERLFAKKILHLHEVPKQGDQLVIIVELALMHSTDKTKVVVFIQSPEDAKKIHNMLAKGLLEKEEENWRNEHNSAAMPKKEKEGLQRSCKEAVSILTGEIRGHERDMLLQKPGMLPFTGKAATKQAVYLVSTSAGEVGMNLHADHMVSDLSTLDSMIQRLGRVNRFGQTESLVDVVYEAALNGKGKKEKSAAADSVEEVTISEEEGKNKTEKKEKDESSALRNTLALFRKHMKAGGSATDLNVCPAALLELLKEKEAADAFAPIPDMVSTTDILLDLWSQTSMTEIPARPEVAPWLHGIQKNLPETWMAWRQEISLLCDANLADDEIARWFNKFPISSRETLRKPTYRLKWTGAAEKKWIESHKDHVIFVLLANGQGQCMTISELAEQQSRLNFATIVFSTQLGGLNENGFFDIESQSPAVDVGDDLFQRIVLQRRGDLYRFVPIIDWQKTPEREEDEKTDKRPGWFQWTTLKDAVRTAENAMKKKALFKLKIRDAKEWENVPHEWWLMLFKENRIGKEALPTIQNSIPTIDDHNLAVAETIRIMADKTALPAAIKEALYLAAAHHDHGKAHARWQTAAGHDSAAGLAKPVSGGIDWCLLNGYRHELGSVMKALENEVIMNHAEHNLILHLIATHHGWARPHFDDRAFSPEVDEETRNRINLDIMTRYIKLQERFGYWQLAWLESLLRRADGIASMQQGANEEANDE